jgi:hypothetical protein
MIGRTADLDDERPSTGERSVADAMRCGGTQSP